MCEVENACELSAIDVVGYQSCCKHTVVVAVMTIVGAMREEKKKSRRSSSRRLSPGGECRWCQRNSSSEP